MNYKSYAGYGFFKAANAASMRHRFASYGLMDALPEETGVIPTISRWYHGLANKIKFLAMSCGFNIRTN